MLQFNSLTNVRPTKDLGCKIICAPTEGQFKITPEAAKALDVRSGDYLQIVESDGNFYAVKGEPGIGGKVAASNKTGGGVLSFSAAAAWLEMGGDSAFNTQFNLETESVIEQEDRNYYPLTNPEKVAKQARKNSTTTDVDSSATTDVDSSTDTQEDSSFEDM